MKRINEKFLELEEILEIPGELLAIMIGIISIVGAFYMPQISQHINFPACIAVAGCWVLLNGIDSIYETIKKELEG